MLDNKNLKILVISSEEYHSFFNDIFRKTNYKSVITFSQDGLEGIKEIKKNKYDIIFINTKLPYIRGELVLLTLKALKIDDIFICMIKENRKIKNNIDVNWKWGANAVIERNRNSIYYEINKIMNLVINGKNTTINEEHYYGIQ
jgi:DNA-binding response OmpR family regulator